MNNEVKYKVLPLNTKEEVIVAINTPVYYPIIECGNFVLMEDTSPCTLVSLWSSVGEPVILIWKSDDDGVYRPKLDINLETDGTIIIIKPMKESSRRIDVKMVY